jgi:hypothetical protein
VSESRSAAILAAVVAASCRHSQSQSHEFSETEGKMPSGQPAGSWRYIEKGPYFHKSLFHSPKSELISWIDRSSA